LLSWLRGVSESVTTTVKIDALAAVTVPESHLWSHAKPIPKEESRL
jgi:hypothetical protein